MDRRLVCVGDNLVDVTRRAGGLHRPRCWKLRSSSGQRPGSGQRFSPAWGFGTAKHTRTVKLLQHRTTTAAALGRVVLVHKNDSGENTDGLQ